MQLFIKTGCRKRARSGYAACCFTSILRLAFTSMIDAEPFCPTKGAQHLTLYTLFPPTRLTIPQQITLNTAATSTCRHLSARQSKPNVRRALSKEQLRTGLAVWLVTLSKPNTKQRKFKESLRIHQLTSRSSERNREQSPLLRLPGEIRNRIYEHVFSGNMLNLRMRGNECVPLCSRFRSSAEAREHCRQVRQFTHICRGIYTEARLSLIHI